MRKKYYEDAKENTAFERCADVITSLILKYGPALKRKWNLNEWIRNIQAESLWKDIACKRYQRYFIHMMNMKVFMHDKIKLTNTDYQYIIQTKRK